MTSQLNAGCRARNSTCCATSDVVALRANLVFLDLQMPGLGAFEVVQRLRGGEVAPAIVVTALKRARSTTS